MAAEKLNRSELQAMADIWSRLAKDPAQETHQARTTAQALQQLLDETDWRLLDGKAMSGTPVILAVIDDTGTHEPVIGEARYYETEEDWYWAGTSPLDHHGGPVREVNFGKPKYYRPMPTLPKELL
jgi:hypothetical protein